MKINPTIFREYDIRGRIDREDELSDGIIDVIGRAFAVFLKRRGIQDAIIGHDARSYSERVKDITVRALLNSGINVIEIGKVIVPIFYFSQYLFKKKGGVMVTASHNPLGWSGFKHAYDYSTTFIPQDMQELKEIVSSGEFNQGRGRHEMHPEASGAYEKDVLSRIRITRPLRVLVDTGNGTAGLFAPRILREAGCEVLEQYTEVSEKRHHEANPSTLKMLEAMSQGVLVQDANVGLGFDDDGDRIGAVDDKGQTIWPDMILLMLARPILARNPGAKVVFDVKCSEALVEDVKAHGGNPIMWKTGHSYIKAKAKEEGAHIAGERSGHMYFPKEHYEFDDAIFAALKFLEFISNQSKPISAVVALLPSYFTSPVWHTPCDDTLKYGVVKKLTLELKEEYGADKVIDINGARVYIKDGWGLVRASSNLPALVLVFESKTKDGLEKIESIFRKKLASYPEIGQEWNSS